VIRRGILLYSGGLDSLLAGKLLLDQGIDLIGYHFILPFTPPDADPENLMPSIYARQIGLPLKHLRCGKDYMAMVKNPPHGHGKNINPCIDCKIHFMRKAAEALGGEGASFVATGEVVGQRPMSQMGHMMSHIEKESGLRGRLLRPLCAKRLAPTEAELAGIVDRERLLDLYGRNRKPQFELARRYGITEYASPAGGCLFTDVKIALRVRDLLDRHEGYTMNDVYLLTIGRHFRLHDRAKFIVSRNEKENMELEKYRESADLFFEPELRAPRPSRLGELTGEDTAFICAALSRYGRPAEGAPVVRISARGAALAPMQAPPPASDADLERMRIQ